MKSGFAFIDKPAGITSHDVVSQVRRMLGTKRVGHAGTLDPFATGLLILGVNKATRLLGFLLGLDKTYRATMRLGISTDTDDLTGTHLQKSKTSHLDDLTIRETLATHIGKQLQIPSTFSAKKIGGMKAYELARRGEEVSLDAKEITIYSIHVLAIEREAEVIDVEFDVTCSSGTYIRAIARDIGNELGVGGHVVSLRRTAIGDFSLENASPPNSLTLHSMTDVCKQIMPVYPIDDDTFANVQHGKQLLLDTPEGLNALVHNDEVVALVESSQGIISYKAVLTDS